MAGFSAIGDVDHHTIRGDVTRKGHARYGKGFSFIFLDAAYGQPRGTIGAVLCTKPRSRKGKIIIAHFLGTDPRQLWPGEEWNGMIETFRPTLRKNFTPAEHAKERQKLMPISDMETAA